jgi:glycosyltransferase involved in cell wall biosynthesis
MEFSESTHKVLYGIDSIVRGGTELQLVGLIERLDKSKFTPYLLTIRETETSLIPNDCKHIQLDIPKLFSVSGIIKFFKLVGWLRKEKIDIVQMYFQDTTLLLGMAAWLARVPVRISCFRDMGFWTDGKIEKILKKVYPLMTNYIANAKAVGNVFCQQFNLPPEKIQILPNGIELSQFPFIQHTDPIVNICIVGNMTRKVKRTDLFIKAAAELVGKYPNVVWHIIGDGHLRPELEALAMELGVSSMVKFLGRIVNVDDYLTDMQIGVISSDSEGLSNAILEYMLKGVVCVATDVGGTPELIIDNETGCLVRVNDHKMIAKKIEYLIENPETYQKIALNARGLAESNYGWDTCVKKHEGFYQKAMTSINKVS